MKPIKEERKIKKRPWKSFHPGDRKKKRKTCKKGEQKSVLKRGGSQQLNGKLKR